MDSKCIWLISLYLILNIFVTVSSKRIEPRIQSAWLLTFSHAISTFIITGLVSWVKLHPLESGKVASQGKQDEETVPHGRCTTPVNFRERLHTHYCILLPFGLLYTINIVMSNWTLGLVSLTMHQNIRATVPAITVILSITILRKPWTDYSLGIYGAVLLTICGVMWATSSAQLPRDGDGLNLTASRTDLSGFSWTFLGAILAVFKTITSSQLQRPAHQSRIGLTLSSWVLVRYCSLYAMCLTILIASWNGDFARLITTMSSNTSWNKRLWVWLWLVNALATTMLNIISFEAANRCGPLSMGIASNAKQIVVLLIDLSSIGRDTTLAPDAGKGVILGILTTICGGIWYTFATVQTHRKPGRTSLEEDGLTVGKQG